MKIDKAFAPNDSLIIDLEFKKDKPARLESQGEGLPPLAIPAEPAVLLEPAEQLELERLRELGVRMLAPAHVMDNRAVGSSTGRRRQGLSGFGHELVAELEQQRVLVDLAHMSTAGIEACLTAVTRPPTRVGVWRCPGAPIHWR